jgi:hypothetical protein
LRDFDYSDNDFFNLHHSGNYLYRVGANKVMCLDCPKDENEFGDVEGGDQFGDNMDQNPTKTTTISIDGSGVTVDHSASHPQHPPYPPQEPRLEVKDGVVVKRK